MTESETIFQGKLITFIVYWTRRWFIVSVWWMFFPSLLLPCMFTLLKRWLEIGIKSPYCFRLHALDLIWRVAIIVEMLICYLLDLIEKTKSNEETRLVMGYVHANEQLRQRRVSFDTGNVNLTCACMSLDTI